LYIRWIYSRFFILIQLKILKTKKYGESDSKFTGITIAIGGLMRYDKEKSGKGPDMPRFLQKRENLDNLQYILQNAGRYAIIKTCRTGCSGPEGQG